MEAVPRGRDKELTALLIAPDRDLARQFLVSAAETRAFQVLADLKSYPPRPTLDIRLRQLKPDVVLLDVASDAAVSTELIKFIAGCRPVIHVAGLHTRNDSEAVVRTLRSGAAEFLFTPFDPSAQREAVQRLRRLMRPEPTATHQELGRVVLFTSAKPGAGASTLATHTAFAIRRHDNARVLLADLDLFSGTIAFYLKLTPEASVTEALENASRLEAGLWSELVVNVDGVDVLTAPETAPAGEVQAASLHDMLEYARQMYDYVLVDTPTVFHRLTLLAVSECDQAYLVTTADLASLHLARKAVNFLVQLGFGRDRYQVIVNRLSKFDGITGGDLEKIFNCQVHASFPNDYSSLHRVLSLGQTLGADCELGKAVANLARQLAGGQPRERGESRNDKKSEKKKQARPEIARPALSRI